MAIFNPTLAQQDLIAAFSDQLYYYGHVLLSGTNSFPCLMAEANPADPELLEFFQDKREVSIAEVLRTDFPSWLVAQMTLTDENGQDWVAVNIADNPATISTKFTLIKVEDVDT